MYYSYPISKNQETSCVNIGCKKKMKCSILILHIQIENKKQNNLNIIPDQSIT